MRLSVVRDRCSIHRGKIVALSCVVAMWFVAAVPASAAVINVIPSMTSATVGDVITVGFYAEDVNDLHGFGISFGFTKSVLDFVEGSVVAGDFLPTDAVTFDSGFFEQDEPDDPLRYVRFVQAFPDSSVPGVTGDGLLFSASFVARAAGLADIIAFFPLTDYLQDSGGGEGFPSDIPVTQVNNGTLTVSPRPTNVPEPGTLLLLSTGIAASVVARRRKRRGPPLRQ